MNGFSRYDEMAYGHREEILTRDELQKRVDEEWSYMSEAEKSGRLRDGDPTFLEFVLSSMYSQNANKVELNEYTNEYKIIKDGN